MQGHTYQEEKEAGFIWAAKQNRGGMPSHSWDRVSEVEEGDLIFHYVSGEILAVSVAEADCEIAHRPVSDEIDAKGYLVRLVYHELDEPLQIRSNLDAILPHLPVKYSPFQPNGHGNQGYLYPCNEELTVQLLELIADANITEVEDEQLEFAISAVVPIERNTLIPLLTEAESKMKTKIRLGEQKFSENMMNLWTPQCVLCDIDLPALLTASRSKPWKDSTEVERIDPYNGAVLCCNHDALYKKGYIAFDGQGRLHISPQLSEEDYEKYRLHKNMKIARKDGNQPYFKWHKKHLFKNNAEIQSRRKK